MKDEKALYERKAEAKLRQVEAKIAELKAVSDEAGADLQLEINRKIEQFRSERRQIDAGLAKLKSGGAQAFADLKQGTEQALADLTGALDTALSRFR